MSSVLLLTAIIMPLFSVSGDGQIFDENGIKGLPVFRYNIFRSLTEEEDKYILNIHADIANDRLQFLKKDSIYDASYSIAAAVYSGTETDVIPQYQKSTINRVVTKEYKETQSPRSKESHSLKFGITNGVYTAVITLKDLNTQKKHTVRRVLEFHDRAGLKISDLRMVYWTDDSDFEKSYEPLINNVVDKQNNYTGAMFEIFTGGNEGVKDFSIRYKIIGSSGNTVYDDLFKGTIKDKLQLQVLKIPLENIGAGNYRIEMEIDIGGSKIQRSAIFYLRWKDLSLNVADISVAVEQMLYITEFDSVSHVFKMTDEEKKAWFKEYWNRLEMSLGLKSNSLMDEYFRRIAYANMHFSVPKKAGWKTDMGKVLCVYGDPDEVQSYPFTKNTKPYEVWIYYESEQQFIFDYTGGEYRLRK
jgi:GWxTD domain-containing protein